jgi:DNA-binding MarR family transcriptional regulator
MDETRQGDVGYDRVMLRLLASVELDSGKSQRKLATELGIALGLVNAYLKRCVKKGLIKAHQAPARRYAYYLTPKGFAEKSKLTVDYLSYSFKFFREAKSDCSALLSFAKARGMTRFALAGGSDLAEIFTICALECGVVVNAVVDRRISAAQFSGVPVFASLESVLADVDAVIMTDLTSFQQTYSAAVNAVGVDRVLVPSMLRPQIQPDQQERS